MKKFLVAVLGVFALAWSSSCARGSQEGPKEPHEKGMSEWIVLPVAFDESTRVCRLAEQTPGEIRTASDRKVTWIVVGGCPGNHTIAIDRQLKKGSGGHDLFTGSAPIQTNATDGSRMEGKLRQLNKDEKGLYQYQVLIDDDPAQYGSNADLGDFYACPNWPCGRFQF